MSREGCEERLDPAAVGAQPPRGGASQRTLAGHWEFSKLRIEAFRIILLTFEICSKQ